MESYVRNARRRLAVVQRRPRARPPSVPRLPSAAALRLGCEMSRWRASERKDKRRRRKITAVLRTNDRTKEGRRRQKRALPSSLPHSLAPAAMDGWRHRHATFCNASTLRRNWSNGRLRDADTAATNNARAGTVVDRHGRMTWRGGDALPRMADAKKGLTHTCTREPEAPVHASRVKSRPKF